jgi:hypothetical protein
MSKRVLSHRRGLRNKQSKVRRTRHRRTKQRQTKQRQTRQRRTKQRRTKQRRTKQRQTRLRRTLKKGGRPKSQNASYREWYAVAEKYITPDGKLASHRLYLPDSELNHILGRGKAFIASVTGLSLAKQTKYADKVTLVTEFNTHIEDLFRKNAEILEGSEMAQRAAVREAREAAMKATGAPIAPIREELRPSGYRPAEAAAFWELQDELLKNPAPKIDTSKLTLAKIERLKDRGGLTDEMYERFKSEWAKTQDASDSDSGPDSPVPSDPGTPPRIT